MRILGERIDLLLAEARQMKVTTDEIVQLVRQRDQDMQANLKEK